MALQAHLKRAIGANHEQPGRILTLGPVGQKIHRGGITPVQILKHEHKRVIDRQMLQGFGQLPQHQGSGGPLHQRLKLLALVLTQQGGQMDQTGGRILA